MSPVCCISLAGKLNAIEMSCLLAMCHSVEMFALLEINMIMHACVYYVYKEC